MAALIGRHKSGYGSIDLQVSRCLCHTVCDVILSIHNNSTSIKSPVPAFSDQQVRRVG